MVKTFSSRLKSILYYTSIRSFVEACSFTVHGSAGFFNNFRIFLRKKQIYVGRIKTVVFVGTLYQHRSWSEMTCQTVLEYFSMLLSEESL